MQSVSNVYARLIGSPRMAPIYIVSFEGIPTRYATAAIQDQLGPTLPYLRVPSGSGQQVTPDEGRSSISLLNFSILDKAGEITYLLFQYQMANRMVTIKTGFQGMPETSFSTVFVGRVLTYTLEKSNTFWNFKLTDLQRDTKQQIFTALTSLTGAVNAIVNALPVSNASDFAAASAGQFFVRIDNEVISYTGKTPTSFTGCARGQFGTLAVSHNSGAEVKNFVVLQDNPLTLALQILTSTGLGTNGAYDVLPASAGLGILQANVNIARFERERDRWTTGLLFRFEEQDKIPGKQFLEEQIYTLIPAYPVVDNEGKLSIKVAAPPLPTDLLNQQPLTDDNLTERPSFMGNVLDHYFFNELDLAYDWDFLTQTFGKRSIYEDAASQQLFDQVVTRTMQSRGLRTLLTSQPKIDNFGRRFLKRYAIPAPPLQAKGLFATRLIEVGDVLPLTSAKLPNLANGTIGVTALLVEVINVAPQYASGMVSFTLLNTPYSYGRKYGAITPTTRPPINFPVWSLATPTQRNYAFISTKVSDTRGVMSDGSDGYYISP